MSSRLEQLQKLFDADPNDPFVTYGLALEHFKLGRHDEAIEWLERTIELDEHYHYAYFQKAKALGELGRDDDAKHTLRTGVELAHQANDDKAKQELTELLDHFD